MEELVVMEEEKRTMRMKKEDKEEKIRKSVFSFESLDCEIYNIDLRYIHYQG